MISGNFFRNLTICEKLRPLMSGICVSVNTLNAERQRIYSTWQRLQAVWTLERAEELLIAIVSY